MGFKRNGNSAVSTLKIGTNNPDTARDLVKLTLSKWGFIIRDLHDEDVNHWIMRIQNAGQRNQGIWRIHYLIKSNTFTIHKHQKPGYVGDYSRLMFKNKDLSVILEKFKEIRVKYIDGLKKQVEKYNTIIADTEEGLNEI